MRLKKASSLLALLLFVMPAFTYAGHGHEEEHSEVSLKDKIKQDIKHHLGDSHDFHLFTDEETGKHYGFPLPVILLDEGLHFSMSSVFHHGHELYETDGKRYMLFHSKIYNLEEEIYFAQKKVRNILKDGAKDSTEETYVDTVSVLGYHDFYHNYIENEHAHLPEDTFIANSKPLDFSLTKNVFFIIVISILLFWIFSRAAKGYKQSLAPKGIAKFLEPIIIFIRDDIAIPNIGEKHYRRFMGYLLTVFFFIWMVNLFGLTPLGVNVTNNIAVTFALAIMTFVITQFSGKKDYWMHIFWMPGVPVPMKIILAPIELLGVFIKPFALMIRLYANITAGHVVLMSILGLMFIFKSWIGSPLSFGLALALSLLELLVAALQAYIFTMLTALYFGSAVEEHGDEH